jgi:hypothetical protein
LTKKNLIIGGSLAAIVLLTGLAVVIWQLYSLHTRRLSGYQPPEIPAELHDPRVVLGQDFLARKTFLRTVQGGAAPEVLKEIGVVNDIGVGKIDGRQGIDVVIAGMYGAMIVNRDGVVRSHTQYEFERPNTILRIFASSRDRVLLGDIKIIDIEGDHVCEYLGRGGIDGAAVFAHDGRRLWSYGRATKEKFRIDDLAAGDLDGDSLLEFVAVWDGIEVIDRHGMRRAQVHDSVFDMAEVVDVDGDGKNEIVHGSGSAISIRDPQGILIKEVKMPFYIGYFSLCDAPGSSRPHILNVEDGALWLADFEGKVAAKFDAPLSEFPANVKVHEAKGVWVKLSTTDPEYLAVIANFTALDRSLLCVYRADGKLLYQEVLPSECKAIASLPKGESKLAQALIVGGKQMVWRYEAR